MVVPLRPGATGPRERLTMTRPVTCEDASRTQSRVPWIVTSPSIRAPATDTTPARAAVRPRPCCGGTGLRNHTKYQESVYFRSADDSTLWVNLFVSSTLDWAEKGFRITQQTDFPREQATRITVDGSGRLAIKLRVPAWVRNSQPHSPYVRRVEPEIVFGSIRSGVPNVKRNDGLPNYDVPVAGIQSPGTDGLTFLDVVWDEAPFATHGAFGSTVARTAEAFVAAGLLTAEQKDRVVSSAGRAQQELRP
jgi:glycosyl hydrolase family 127 (putative beta-L-arabinofuranosidase)